VAKLFGTIKKLTKKRELTKNELLEKEHKIQWALGTLQGFVVLVPEYLCHFIKGFQPIMQDTSGNFYFTTLACNEEDARRMIFLLSGHKINDDILKTFPVYAIEKFYGYK